MIFVFGSNLAGRHGAGAALAARQKHGAQYGNGKGRQGNSYAIPTKDRELKTLPLDIIQGYVEEFLHYARDNPDEKFQLTAIGCGLAGYNEKQIAPMFKTAGPNIWLPSGFERVLAK